MHTHHNTNMQGIAFISGLIIGGAAVALLNPKSGPEVRRALQSKARQTSDTVQQKARDSVERARENARRKRENTEERLQQTDVI